MLDAGMLPVCCAVTLCGGGKSTRRQRWVSLTVGRAVAGGTDMGIQSRSDFMRGFMIQQTDIMEAEGVLLTNKIDQLRRFLAVLGQQQIAALSIMQIRFQLLREARPARNGLAGQQRLSRMATLAAHATRAGPGSDRSS